MEIGKRKLGKKEVFPFTIPSGIIATEVSVLERIANEIPEVGILTTKSIGPVPREGNREPIIAEYSPCCFTNAVGLTNPGAEEFSKRLSSVRLPEDKFLLVSVFGKDAAEFSQVVRVLEKNADGFELNLSCPHAQGYGMQLGQDPKIVADIVTAVKKVTNKPVFAKLTPNAANIAVIAKAAVDSGAYGLTAINTVGPGAHVFDGHYVLTNKVGGLSGKSITPIGVKCVKDITESLGNVPIIGCGGIYTARDVEAYSKAGASFFGIGSALAGMKLAQLKQYFSALAGDVKNGTRNAEAFLKPVNMDYMKFKVAEKVSPASDFHILTMDRPLEAVAGQFVFAWLPGKGEKPFSVMDCNPLTLGVLEKGCFTKELGKLNKGDDIYFRGPYGEKIEIPRDKGVVLVGGGSGIAGIYLFAKQKLFNNVTILLGAKDAKHIPFLEELKKCGEVHVATEDGSLGDKGFVTLLLEKYVKKADYFVNCGPKPMVDAVLEIEKKFTTPDRIFSSLDYVTKCGVGLCGSCANDKGLRTCVEGPFVKHAV